ncbi:MAG: peptide transporter permease [Acidimicrobiales bacterium]|nr:peptide transporter permease [Acidimicrobiales bacterium]
MTIGGASMGQVMPSSAGAGVEPGPNIGGVAAVSDRKLVRKENWRLIRRRPGFIIGGLVVAFWVACALFGSHIAPKSAFGTQFPSGVAYPTNQSPNGTFWFGTDRSGRDVFARVIVGARDVLAVAPLAAILSVVAGTVLGLLMGYVRGLLDNIISRLVEAFLSLPVLLIALLSVTTLGNSRWIVITVVAVLFTPIVARTVRSAVITEADLDYVTSAKLRGETTGFIMFREVLPNVTAPIIVELTVRIGYAIFTVASLAFLGAGPQPPSADWGAQVSLSYGDLNAGFWWPTIFPALAIATLVIAVNLIADAVQSVIEA